MRKFVAVICFTILHAVEAASAEQSPVFPTPTTFVDLKRTEPSAQAFANSGEHFADAKRFDAYAVKIEDGRVVAKFVVKIFPGLAPVSMRETTEKAIKANTQLSGTKVLSSTSIVIEGASCGRVEVERNVDGAVWDQLLYDIPTGDHWASVAVDARHDRYPEEARNLDAFIRTIPGISSQQSAEPSDGHAAAELGGLLLIIGLGGWVGGKRKRNRKTRRRPTTA